MMNMATGAGISRYEILLIIARFTFATAIGYFSIKWIMNTVDPMNTTKKKAQQKAKEKLQKLAQIDNASWVENIDQFTDYEMMIASHLIDSRDIQISWKNIAGLEHVIQELKETVILPIQRKELFEDSRLTRAPKGILLYGPPGCGKTMIAKATAKETTTRFINLDVSILTEKWYGESQKLTAAVFSLAKKLQPCIIFIDEIDSFLRARSSQDHEATAMMKAQFMSLWDGLITDPSCTVIVMGATNRPQDLDKAILRRMSATFHIGLPDEQQRKQVFELILDNEPLANDVDVPRLAMLTEGFSGSDLQELCRQGSVYRVRDYLRDHSQGCSTDDADGDEFHDTIRPITMEDLLDAYKRITKSKLHTEVGTLNRLDLD